MPEIVAVRAANFRAGEDVGRACWLWCPGCNDAHRVIVESPDGGPAWGWNGDVARPTFTPSLLVRGVQWAPEYGFHKPTHHVEPGQPIVCHSFISDGQWQFLGDCTHTLAGQTVPVVPIPNEWQEKHL